MLSTFALTSSRRSTFIMLSQLTSTHNTPPKRSHKHNKTFTPRTHHSQQVKSPNSHQRTPHEPWATITMRTSKTTRPVRALFARNHPSVAPCPLTSLLLSPPSQTTLRTTTEEQLRPQRRRPRPRRRNGRSSGGSKRHASHWCQPLVDRERSRCSKPTSAEGRRRHHSQG